jgi:hypothetical protein
MFIFGVLQTGMIVLSQMRIQSNEFEEDARN